MKDEDPYLDELISRLNKVSAAVLGQGIVKTPPAPEASPAAIAVALPPSSPPAEPPIAVPPAAPANRPGVLPRPPIAGTPSPVTKTVAAAVARERGSLVEHLRQPQTPLKTAADLTQVSFMPVAPESLQQARLTESEVQSIILKFLLYHLAATGRLIAEQIKLPFRLVEQQLAQLKIDRLVVHKGSAPMGDYIFQLTAAGQEDARRANRHCSYFGSVPVHLDDYIASVNAQSMTRRPLSSEQLDVALADLVVEPSIKNQVGQALHAGQGFFIYGAPGNGKTSIAERVGRAYGETIWIPRAIGIDGEIIRVFDPCQHVEIQVKPEEEIDLRSIDQRWIRIRRPTIIAGGELTLDRLEVTVNVQTGTGEAPLQMKSNCGTLVIDDFGRQRMEIAELLNRWIVPLDKRHDYLNLRSGKTIQVPFDQLLVFSTNLEPRDLVDEAFMRRIPYKIEVFDPSEAEFRQLLQMYADRLEVKVVPAAIDYLIHQHYKSCDRPFRYCHPRDLLLQTKNYCMFNKLPVVMSPEAFDIAVRNYFAVMGG